MQLSRNFTREEFDCHDGTKVPANLLGNLRKLVKNVQAIRDEIGRPVIVNSGYRTPAYNANIGGASHSQHLKAKAADIRVKGMSADKLHGIIVKMIKEHKIHNGGLGWYNDFCHYDVRPSAARWDFRK